MKKLRAVALVAVLALVMAGCGQQAETGAWDASENSIYINRSLEIESALVYTSEKENDTYNQEELKAFAETAVVEYNTANGGAEVAVDAEGQSKLPVALKSCTLAGKTGTLVFDYATGEDFVKFAKESGDLTHTVTKLSVNKVSDAEELLEGTFIAIDGKAATTDDVLKQSEAFAVEIEGAATVYTEGQVLYMSSGVTMRDSFTASTPEGKSYIVFK